MDNIPGVDERLFTILVTSSDGTPLGIAVAERVAYFPWDEASRHPLLHDVARRLEGLNSLFRHASQTVETEGGSPGNAAVAVPLKAMLDPRGGGVIALRSADGHDDD